MIAADRKFRSQRTTALTCGVMAEVITGTVLLVWSGSPLSAERAVFGRGGSVGAVAASMTLLAVSVIVIASAPRLGRGVLLIALAMVWLAIGSLGVIVVATLFQQPDIGFPLCFGWVLMFPVATAIGRAEARSRQDRTGRFGGS
jgi:hypothetical protein